MENIDFLKDFEKQVKNLVCSEYISGESCINTLLYSLIVMLRISDKLRHPLSLDDPKCKHLKTLMNDIFRMCQQLPPGDKNDLTYALVNSLVVEETD